MPDTVPNPNDDTSSSSKTHGPQSTIVEEEVEEEEIKRTGATGKLSLHHLQAFGFNLAEEAKREPGKWDGGGGAGGGEIGKAIAAAKQAQSKNKNQAVVYGDVGDTDFNDQDYDEPDYPVVDDDDSDKDEDEDTSGEEGDDEEGEMVDGEKPPHNYFDDYNEADDMWEDEEEEEDEEGEEDEEELDRLRQEAYEAALLAAEEERERIRDLRLAEIMKKKEVLIERYLKVARVMISHRKKNIYLQDYLYHLAFRKGVLRGDPNSQGSMDSEEAETKLSKALKRRQQKKNSTMAARFARFLRKTGHFHDEIRDEHHHHHHHHHQQKDSAQHHNFHAHHGQHHGHHGHHNRPTQQRSYKSFGSNAHHRHHHYHYGPRIPNTLIRKNTKCPEASEGKDCPLNRKTRAKIKRIRNRHLHPSAGSRRSPKSSASRSGTDVVKYKPRTLAELLEQKAEATMHRAMKKANEALDAFERHRCRMAKKKQLIKIAKLLERQYSGTSVIDAERFHLVSFVESSVKEQNLAKKKALRRQQKNQTQNQKTGVVNLNHQWTKSLERIRELRLKKAKLEQEHRLVLLRKVKHWHIWEKREATALESVYDFVAEMASKVSMSRGESLSFQNGLDQFHKQLNFLHATMIEQVVKMLKAQHKLYMVQRRVKDNTSVAAPVMKGFTISDYERMIIENQESHAKLTERQEHLVVQYEKLKRYIKQVADSHLKKQRSWGSLRTGKHDMRQLWELCLNERSNLIRKIHEIRRVTRLHKRLFMQIAVLENKRLFKNFHEMSQRVKELEDHERDLQTQLHQAQSLLRVLNTKFTDTQLRSMEEDRENKEKVIKEGLKFSKETIKQRIAPRLPNTVYNVNIGSVTQQKDILETEKGRSANTPTTKVETQRKSSLRNKLPQI